jgi:hypothetical protein
MPLAQPSTAQSEIARLRRIATTYEAFALIQSPESPERAATAFVAATAHQLLGQAVVLGLASKKSTTYMGCRISRPRSPRSFST